MTATAPPTVRATDLRRSRRRWPRAVAPFAVVLALFGLTGVAHAIVEPDPRDPGTLSPTGTGPDGSSELARQLTAHGVTITRVTSSQAAVAAAGHAGVTVLIPFPDFLSQPVPAQVASSIGARQVVVLHPGLATQLNWVLPVFGLTDRWATAVRAPDCTDELAARAGPAAVRRGIYAVSPLATTDCYDGGVVASHLGGGTDLVVVAATDPFRNSRIHEVGNATLATGLLSRYPELVWVDVHAAEPRPAATFQLPGWQREDQSRGGGSDPTWAAFPTVLWGGLALAAGVALLVALVAARRLGPPVVEPLPVLVPAAETVSGRGRLYERIAARDAALAALRAAAIVRIAKLVNPPGEPVNERELTQFGASPAAQTLIDRVADRIGARRERVAATLYGPHADTDAGLAEAVAEVDALVATIAQEPASMPSDQPDRGGPW
jgi:uncharacterized protein DUF4350